MTVPRFIGIMRRRWYLIATVAFVTIVVGLGFARDGGLYATRTVVTFEVPGAGPWEDGGSSYEGAVLIAAAVAKQIDGGDDAVNYASADAPFYGAGVSQGVRVGPPDTGGQWGVAYSRAAINIEVVSPSYDWVEARQQEYISAAVSAAEVQQASIPVESRFLVAVEPLTTTIDRIVPNRTSQVLATAALAAVGCLVGGWLAVVSDRRASRRKRGRSAIKDRTLELKGVVAS